MHKISTIFNKIFSRLEENIHITWFNPLLTIYVNFRSLPFKQACRLPIWCYGRLRVFNLSGSMRIDGKVRTGDIRINQMHCKAPSIMSIQSEIGNEGEIIFKGKCYIGTGNKIYVGEGAKLEIGEHVEIMNLVNIGCLDHIVIGSHSWIVHRCQVFDTNYHFIANLNTGEVKKHHIPVSIGNYCWICNSTTISMGTIIPDHTIVSSNSVLNKDYSKLGEYNIIGGTPAKKLKDNYSWIEDKQQEHEIDMFFKNNTSTTYRI